jgi:hypothetical protein
MIVRGSLERLTPVLMTALVAAFALVPLLLSADAPGKEVLHPVAVVIFGGLVSSTLLDTLLTPVMFRLWGEKCFTAASSRSLSPSSLSFTSAGSRGPAKKIHPSGRPSASEVSDKQGVDLRFDELVILLEVKAWSMIIQGVSTHQEFPTEHNRLRWI